MNTPIALRLAIRQWLARPLRPVLCSLAIGAAVALIVVVGVAMDSLRATVDLAIGQVLGVAEVQIRPSQRNTDSRLPHALLEKLRARPDVELVSPRLVTTHQAMLAFGGKTSSFDVIGIAEPLDETLRPKTMQAGRTLSGQSDEILIDTSIAEKLALHVGDSVVYAIGNRPPRTLRVVGIVKRPVIEFISKPTLFVPLATLSQDLQIPPPGEYSILDLKLRHAALPATGADGGTDSDFDYDQYAKELGKELGPSVDVSAGTHSKSNMQEATRTLRLLLSVLSALSAICAALIIGTTLSVGVQERVRQFGQLRCIGASRSQLASFLLADALVMLLFGEIVGVALGLAVSALLIYWFPQFFQTFALSPMSLLIACACGALATFLGALIPIWQVTRVPPMAAVTAVARRTRFSRIVLAAVLGLLCLLAQQLLWRLPASRDVRVFAYIFCGIDLIFVGWCLLAPLAVVACEKVGAQVLGRIFFVRPSLLRNAWSRTPWRAGAMIAALMIGVTIFTTVRARGESVLTSFPTPHIPDLVAKSVVWGFNQNSLDDLQRRHPELRDIIPFEYFTVKMKTDKSALDRIVGTDTTYIAVNMRKFSAQVPLNFVQGDPQTALAQMDDQRVWHVFPVPYGHHYVIVSTEFAELRKMGVGDRITLVSFSGRDVRFTIAAVVSSTSVEMVKNYFDLRASFGEKSVASVLGTVPDAQHYFKMGNPSMLLMNIQPGKQQNVAEIRQQLNDEWITTLSSVDMKASLTGIIQRITNGLSVIGFGALCLASLGVANMVIASIHARRFEFGVLRAIGAGRSQLVRLVLAEVTLIGLIAGILGCGAGLWYAYMISRVDHLLIGLNTSFLNPDPIAGARYALLLLLIAIGLTTLLGWLAALVPAIRGARGAQRVLLAGGRG